MKIATRSKAARAGAGNPRQEGFMDKGMTAEEEKKILMHELGEYLKDLMVMDEIDFAIKYGLIGKQTCERR